MKFVEFVDNMTKIQNKRISYEKIARLTKQIYDVKKLKLSLCENKETYRMLEERMTCRMTNILFNLLDMEQFIETLEGE